MLPLIDQVTCIENVTKAFRECSKGKRKSSGYQRFAANRCSEIVGMSRALGSGHWKWSPYHRFEVCDPKRRVIYAAPFRDRVAHHAIHQVIAPILETKIPPVSWACRKGKGARGAALALKTELERLGSQRFVVKLDVASYFASIRHDLLMAMISANLPDHSLNSILWSLLRSHPEYAEAGRGIPLGNLTSQLFANLFLHPVDCLAVTKMPQIFYVRYMDDMVIAGPSKRDVLDLKDAIITYCFTHLDLTVPIRKKVHLAADPVPFLGYVLSEHGYQVLARTRRRHETGLRRLIKNGGRASELAKKKASFAAFATLHK